MQLEGGVARRRLLLGAIAAGIAVMPPQSARAQNSTRPDQAPVPLSGTGPASDSSIVPLTPEQLEQEATAKLLQEEEERRKARKRKKGRIRELEEIRAELAEKELVLLEKEKELLEKEQTVMVLREELEIEKKLRSLLTKEKEKAEEEASLAMGLCTGGSMLP
ncbi:hypothetical protein D9Q98_006744 [Chlorella vulgaris]|uniref:Uncharacterized protein n=1 Tax=Chlorella vulgaris TaxID=3077 RepID=A0A9D4TKR6_CHLVU|nr:hypothetical protein D9Q98_006744 [Chlorella vulgaris]